MPIRTSARRLAAGLAIAVLAATAQAQVAASDFTYQGRLESGGATANGTFDMQFRLFDAAVAGTQVGPTATNPAVQVDQGLFTIPLDFGAAALQSGQQRWIEISVRNPGAPTYTTLSPRQKLTQAPLATTSYFPWTPSNFAGPRTVFNGSFVGINRTQQLGSAEFFGIRTTLGGNNYGGMYIQTDSADGRPFYGYTTQGGATGWTYLDGATQSWRLWLNQDRITVTPDGNVGIGTTTPTAKLTVDGQLAIIDAPLSIGNSVLAPADNALSISYGNFKNEYTQDGTNNPFGSLRAPNIVLGNLNDLTSSTKSVLDNAYGVFIGGGGSRSFFFGNTTLTTNRAFDNFTTIAGGTNNRAGSNDGDPTLQEGATVSGGIDNNSSGAYAAIPGGQLNRASGSHSFAAGRRALALADGSFVLTDSNDIDFASTLPNAFVTRFTGGYTLVTGISSGGATTSGARLTAGSGSWTSLSDANAKHAFEPVDPAEVLAKLAEMPLHRWSYKAQDPAIRHIGPTAQDFHAAFGVGDDPTGITTVDADGVALAAIQALHTQLKDQADTINTQQALIQAQQGTLEALTRRLETLESTPR